MTPRSTSETTGISGSGISSNAAQTCVRASPLRARGRGAAHASSSRPTAPRARRVCVPRSTASTSSSPTRRASSARCSGGTTPSAYGHSSATASRKRGSSRRRACHSSACMRWYASSRSIFAARPATCGSGVAHQRLDANAIRLLVEPAPRDRVRPVEQPQLDERRAAVLVERPVERERVRVVRQAAGRRRARGRSRSARSTRTRRPPRASARSPSTRSRASRRSARRQPVPAEARSRASFSRALIE